MALPDSSGDDPVLFELYHENSKQRRSDLAFNRRINVVNSSAEIHRVMARAFKSYPGATFTPLPDLTASDGMSFERAAALRRSVRRFDGEPIELDQLARLAWLASGLTGRLDASAEGVVQPVRAAPSGGALYPIELYVAATAVDGLQAGLYHYAVDRHGLELLRPGRINDLLADAANDRATFGPAPVTFVLTAAFGRLQFKYGERSYRFALLEAGHICQNLLLGATALGLGAVAVGGFVDEEVNALLDLDGVDEAAVYLVPAGRPAARPGAGGGPDEDVVGRLLEALWTGQLPIDQDGP